MRSQGSTVRPAPEEQGSVRLTREEPLETVRRVEQPHRMEAESRKPRRKPRRELPQQERELSERQKEIDRLTRHLATLDVTEPLSKMLHQPAASAEPRSKDRRPGRWPGPPPHGRGRLDRVDETLDFRSGQSAPLVPPRP